MDRPSGKRSFPIILHAVSALIYIGTLIITSVELSYAYPFYKASCTVLGCWGFLTTVWFLVIPVAVLSLGYLYWSFWLSRTGRSRDYRQILAISGVLLVGLWLAVVVMGWAVPEVRTTYPTRLTAHFGDLPVSIVIGSEIPVTGMFRWCVDFYNLVINPTGTITQGMVEPQLGAARAGLAAVIFACFSL